VRAPLVIPPAVLRLRSDAQLLALFRAGHDAAFRVLHERFESRLVGYARQMLPTEADAEDVIQEVFVRAYDALRADDRDLAVRAWLYRVAHNRCIDTLRRRRDTPAEPDETQPGGRDPVTVLEIRDDLRTLIADLESLPDQQRSALVIRELEGLSYEELATALDTTVPAVKSLLVRARLGLTEAAQARATSCNDIRGELEQAMIRAKGGKNSRRVREHLRQCEGCRDWRKVMRKRRGRGTALPALGS
jgi:RNA polymerase sigma factor (sigma-70 family)